MSQVTRPKVESALPGDLVEWTLKGRIRIPSFQRSYRWDRHDVTKLFDSIFRGYPIGNLLAWQRPAPAGKIILGPLNLEVPASENAFWIVDGQQRIISLVGALTASPMTLDPRFRIYFDLRHNEFVSVSRNQVPLEEWMPVYEALNTARANHWIRSRPQLSESQIATADEVVAAIRDYRIPMYIVTSDEDHALRDIFDRMNTYGQSLKAEEVFNALHSVPGESDPSDLHTLAEDVLAFGFGELSERILMQSLLAIRAPRIDRDFRDEFRNNADRHSAFVKTEQAIEQIVEFLRNIADIPHIRLLPYTLYIPILARFVATFGLPQEWSAELLRRWIWRGAVVGVAPQGNTIALRQGASAIYDDPVSSANRLLEMLPRRYESWEPDLSQVGLNRAQARLNILGMISREPQMLPAHVDHIPTPVDYIKLLDEGRVFIPIVGSDGLPARTIANRMIYPASKGRSIIHALRQADYAILRSHCIDPSAAELLFKGDTEGFLAHRASDLSSLIAEHVQRHALFGFRDGPDITDLLDDVPGDDYVD